MIDRSTSFQCLNYFLRELGRNLNPKSTHHLYETGSKSVAHVKLIVTHRKHGKTDFNVSLAVYAKFPKNFSFPGGYTVTDRVVQLNHYYSAAELETVNRGYSSLGCVPTEENSDGLNTFFLDSVLRSTYEIAHTDKGFSQVTLNETIRFLLEDSLEFYPESEFITVELEPHNLNIEDMSSGLYATVNVSGNAKTGLAETTIRTRNVISYEGII